MASKTAREHNDDEKTDTLVNYTFDLSLDKHMIGHDAKNSVRFPTTTQSEATDFILETTTNNDLDETQD